MQNNLALKGLQQYPLQTPEKFNPCHYSPNNFITNIAKASVTKAAIPIPTNNIVASP